MSDIKILIIILLGLFIFSMISVFVGLFANAQGLDSRHVLLLKLSITVIPSIIYTGAVLTYLRKPH